MKLCRFHIMCELETVRHLEALQVIISDDNTDINVETRV